MHFHEHGLHAHTATSAPSGAPLHATRSTPYPTSPRPRPVSVPAAPLSIYAPETELNRVTSLGAQPRRGSSDSGLASGHEPGGPRVLVIGLGALGTLLAWLLETRAEVRLTAVARSNYARLAPGGDGVDIASSAFGFARAWKPRGRVVQSAAEAGGAQYDFVVCATKCIPDLVSMADVIAPALPKTADEDPGKKKPAVLMVQHGLEVEEAVHDRLVVQDEVASAVFTASVWMGARTVQGGRCVEQGALQRIDVGLYSTPAPAHRPRVQQQLRALVSLLTLAGITTNLVEHDMKHLHWQKLLWSAAWGGLCCLGTCTSVSSVFSSTDGPSARQPLTALLAEGCINDTCRSAETLMWEVLRVGRACGMDEALLPERCIAEAMAATLQGAPSGALRASNPRRPALLDDWDHGRPNEFAAIFVPLRTRARAYDVPTPALDVLFAALQPTQMQLVARARARGGSVD